MRTKKIVSVVICVAMLLSSMTYNFALDDQTINSLSKDQVTSDAYIEKEENTENENKTEEFEESSSETSAETIEEEATENASETSEELEETEAEANTEASSENAADTETTVETTEETTAETTAETSLETTTETETNAETTTETAVETQAETTVETTTETTTEAKTEVASEIVSTDSNAEKTISLTEVYSIDIATASIFGNANETTNEATSSEVQDANASTENTGKKVIKPNRTVAFGGKPAGMTVDKVKRDNKNSLFGATLDSYFDMRTRTNSHGVSIIPPIRDQNPYGTCWAFSTIGMFETSLRMQDIVDSETHPGADLSEAAMAYFTIEGLEEVTDPNKSTYAIDNPGLEGNDFVCINYDWWWREKGRPRASTSFVNVGGNQIEATLTASAYMGFVPENDFPHTSENLNDVIKNGIGDRSNLAFKSNKYVVKNVDYINKSDIQTIKEAILKNGSVGVTYYEDRNNVNCHEDNGEWYYLSPYKTCKILPDGSCGEEKQLDTNHCVMIVGWDDNVDNSKFYFDGEVYEDKGSYVVASYSIIEDEDFDYYPTYVKQVSPEGKKGAWLIRNSWGDDNYLAKHGYFWLSYYNVTTDNVMYSAEAMEADTYKYNYHYDTTGSPSFSSFEEYGGKMANIFQVNNDRNRFLEAVNVAWRSANVDYTINIYQQDDPMKDPEDGELTLSQKVHHDTAGIKTVQLDKRILLNKDSYYSIVLVPNNLNYDFYVDVANKDDDWDRFFYNEIFEKDSWFLYNGEWQTITATFEEGGKKFGQTPRIKGLANDAYAITFEPGGGTGDMAMQGGKAAETIKINANQFRRPGYTFYKWVDENGEEFDDGEEIILESDVVFTAKWKKNPTPSPSSGDGGGGSSGGSGLGPISNAVSSKTVSKSKTSKAAVDASLVRWEYQPLTNTWGLNILINDVPVKAKDDFYYIKEARKTIVNDVETVVESIETYYIDENGSIVTGWVKTGDNKWYFFETAKTKEEGKMIVGWKQIQNAWYYFNTDGTMLTNGVTPDGYTIGSDGKMI